MFEDLEVLDFLPGFEGRDLNIPENHTNDVGDVLDVFNVSFVLR